jgi:tetratricopeptide (TPR) repeat protein
MRFWLAVVLFIFCCSLVQAQSNKESLKESYVDSLSYVYIISGLHEDLVTLGKDALDAGIDSYLLRYRLGISYFNKGNYLLAAKHFRRSLAYYPADFQSKEYLFYCYLYLNNVFDAQEMISKMTTEIQTYYTSMLPKERFITVESGFQTTTYSTPQEPLTYLGKDGDYAESDRMKSLSYYHIGANFSLFKRLKLYVGVSYLENLRTRHIYAKEINYLYDYQIFNFKKAAYLKDTIQSYGLRQYQSYLGSSVSLSKQRTLQLGFQHLYYNQNKLFATPDSSKSYMLDTLNYFYTYQKVATSVSNMVSSIDFSNVVGRLNTQFCLGFAYIDKTKIYQLGTLFSVRPKGNNTFNFTGGFSLSWDKVVRPIANIKVGGRITKKWWFEAYHYQGNLKNYHEANAFVVYNVSDKIMSKSGVNFSFFIAKDWVIQARYDFLTRSATFTRYVTGRPVGFEDKYINNSFIINLLWKY